MRFPFAKEKRKNENGSVVMMLCIMLLVVLTIVGVMSINMSSNEGNIVRNEQISATELYKAETGLNIARLQYLEWMTDDFLILPDNSADAKEIIYYVYEDDKYKVYGGRSHDALGTSQTATATVKVRNILDYGDPKQNSPESVFKNPADATADTIPSIPHSGTPPAGTGYSAKNFQARRFSVTVKTDNSAVVQAGVWKAFNKY